AVAFEREGRADLARVVVRTARDTAVAPPPTFAPERIVRTRERLGQSQAVFAPVMNVSRGMVSSWEQGARQPSGAALRLLEFAEKSPERFGEYLRELPRVERASRTR